VARHSGEHHATGNVPSLTLPRTKIAEQRDRNSTIIYFDAIADDTHLIIGSFTIKKF